MDTEQVPHQYEHTGMLSDGSVVHYTCNAPSWDVLNKYGITALEGLNDGGDSMFVIPSSVFRRFGYRIGKGTSAPVLTITAENLFARL